MLFVSYFRKTLPSVFLVFFGAVLSLKSLHLYAHSQAKQSIKPAHQNFYFLSADTKNNKTHKPHLSNSLKAFAPLLEPNTSHLPNSLIAEPIIHGTVFLSKDIFTKNDPSAFKSISYSGRKKILINNPNDTKKTYKKSYLFEVVFDDKIKNQLYVMPEFSSYKAALAIAKTVAHAQGRIPAQLRKNAKKIHILKGKGRSFATASSHTVFLYPQDKDIEFLEELLAHESAHLSLDPLWRNHSEWHEAVAKDTGFISEYAKNNQYTEDIAETILAYLAVKYKPQRITADQETTFRFLNAYRFDFFDRHFKKIHPVQDISKTIKAKLTSPSLKKTLNSSKVTFRWSKPKEATNYDIVIGTKGFGSNDIRKSKVTRSNRVTVKNLPNNGKAIYVRLWTHRKNTWRYHDYRIAGYSPHINTASILWPKPGSAIQTKTTTFSWDAPTGSQAFDLIVGTQGAGSNNIRQSKVVRNASKITVRNIPENNGTLYARLWTQKNGDWNYRDFTFQLNKLKAELIGVNNNSTIKSGNFTFKWDRPSRSQNYDLVIGTKGPGSNDIRASSAVANNTITHRLPKGKIYVRLWTQKNGWQYKDYVLNAK